MRMVQYILENGVTMKIDMVEEFKFFQMNQDIVDNGVMINQTDSESSNEKMVHIMMVNG